jgi:hypothetical protein
MQTAEFIGFPTAQVVVSTIPRVENLFAKCKVNCHEVDTHRDGLGLVCCGSDRKNQTRRKIRMELGTSKKLLAGKRCEGRAS